MANVFSHTLKASITRFAAYYGDLTYVDAKRGGNVVGINDSPTVLWTRVRGFASLASRCVQRPDVGVAVRSGAARV